MNGIADTGFLVAFANRRDRHHGWAKALATQITAPLVTCESVLAEAAFHLRDPRIVLAMLETGLIRIAFDCRKELVRLSELAERYADRNPDLADLCLIRMSELFPLHVVITVDRADFSVYRRNRREVIPVVFPGDPKATSKKRGKSAIGGIPPVGSPKVRQLHATQEAGQALQAERNP